MATTIKPFPHYQINVKDNSIYEVEYTTILPVHRPICVPNFLCLSISAESSMHFS